VIETGSKRFQNCKPYKTSVEMESFHLTPQRREFKGLSSWKTPRTGYSVIRSWEGVRSFRSHETHTV
jgi:hypothetical protein